MRGANFSSDGSHRGLVALVVAGVLAVSGVAVLGVALAGPDAAPRTAPPTVPEQVRPTETAPTPSPGVTTLTLPSSKPVSLAIPAIGVRSPLLRLGRASDGTLEVPAPGPHYDDAGWYRHSPTPGELGPSVIVGHVDSATDGPSVFYRLEDLRRHDRVRVARADGSVAIFEVEEVRRFRKALFPTKLVYGDTDHAALRLITCGGPLDSAGHYRDNVVVLASLVGREHSGVADAV